METGQLLTTLDTGDAPTGESTSGLKINRIVFSPDGKYLVGAGLNDAITIETFLYSLLGAVILLAIVNLVRRGSVR